MGVEVSRVPERVRDAVIQRAKGRCECCGIGLATDLHHRMRRRDGGHSPENSLLVDRTCHDRIHAHPGWSRDNGWIVGSLSGFEETIAERPARIGGKWAYLLPDGTYEWV